MKIKEKRAVRGYKIAHTPYTKAMKRAKKEKVSLATMIETWVISYGGKIPYYIDPNSPTIYHEMGEQCEMNTLKSKSITQ